MNAMKEIKYIQLGKNKVGIFYASLLKLTLTLSTLFYLIFADVYEYMNI